MNANEVAAFKQAVVAAIEAQAEELGAISHYLREHPEIGYTEVLASERLADYLESRGFVVERGIFGMATAFRATADSGNPGPTVAFLAEYDALPNIGHGCGHNLIAAGALGAGVGAKAVLEAVGGKIIVLGTPAEEFTGRPQGKIPMLKAGAFDDIDVCFMFHPWTATAPINSSLAFVALDATFHGQTAHAAADPWNGRNALDGVIMTFNHISALRQHIQPDVRIHGIVTDGGIVPNIIPQRAAGQFMLRARKHSLVQKILERVEGCIQGAALSTTTTVDIDISCQTADTLPCPTLQALTRANFKILDVPFGAPIDWTASTDFGDVSYQVPSESFFISLGAGDIPWHSTEVTRATAAAPAQTSMLVGAKVLAMDAVDVLANPSLIGKARAEMSDG